MTANTDSNLSGRLTPQSATSAIGIGLAGLLFSLLWLASLGYRDLIHPDEGRYASISLGMLLSGDWITPRLNGLLYFEKPALQYWAGALSFAVFGINDFAARFWPGLTGLLSAGVVGYTGARLWGREAGCHAAAIMAGSTWIVANGHFLTLDMGVTFFLTLTLCGFVLAQRDGAEAAERRRWMLLAWAAMAGATLSKGLIGLVIPGATLVLYSIVCRQLYFWRRLHLIGGLLLFLALSAPWFVAVSLRNPDFAHFFFIHEHFDRFLTSEHGREGVLWYFVPVLLLGFMPWTSLLPSLLREGFRRQPAERFQTAQLLLIWAVFIFLFFSKSNSKLPSYILPMFPALALLLASRLRTMTAAGLRRHVLLPIVAWTLLLGIYPLAGRFVSDELPLDMLQAFARTIALTAALCLVATFVAWRLLGRGEKLAGILALAVASSIFFTGIQIGHNQFSPLRSARTAVAALAPWLKPDSQLFSVRYYDQTFPYYARRDVTLVEYVDEFAFGEKAEPERWIASLEGFVARWNAAPNAAAMMEPVTYRLLAETGLPIKLVYQDVRRVVVVKP